MSENIQEASPPEDTEKVSLQQQKAEVVDSKEHESHQGDHENPNWKAFREARKKDRAEKEQAVKRAAEKEAEANALKEAMEAAFQKQSSQYQMNTSYSNESEESEDDRISRKVEEQLRKRESENERLRAERERQEYPMRLSQAFPDFNSTISNENIDYLDFHYPEVSRPLQRLPDGFDKWADIYRAIKKFIPNNLNSRQEGLKADHNLSKPKSISSMGVTQPGDSYRSVEEKRAANWDRMQKTLRSLA